MIITYATHHTWVKPVLPNTRDSFGKNARAQLTASLRAYSDAGIRLVHEKITQDFLNRFIPLYEERIREKKHPIIFDIQGKTLGSESKKQYFSQTIWENDVFIGGTIYSIRDAQMRIAYRTFLRKWHTAKLRANPSLLAEYNLEEHAQSTLLHTIIHGKDRNPYGLNSHIGLAIFKLSAGCHPEKSLRYEVATIDTDSITEDALILEYPGDTEHIIRNAYLVTTKENAHLWTQVTRYREQLNVTTLYRPV
jgi:hypothetical protein